MESNVVQFPRARREPAGDTRHGDGDGEDVIRIHVNLDAAMPEESPAAPPKEPSLIPAYFAGIVTGWIFGS